MTQTNFLSTIIREVTEHAKPAQGNEELVTIDVRSGQSVPTPGFLETLTGNFRYFLVSNNRDPPKIIKGMKRVKYKEGQEEIFFAIAYEGGCQPGQEWRLAQCFFKSPRLEDAINDSLARWLIEYFSTGGLTIDDFHSESTNAANVLATKAVREFGLELKIDLRLEGLDTLATLEFGPLLLSSRLKDFAEEEEIWLKIELEVDQQRALRALLSGKTPLTELVKKGVRKYFANHITPEAFYRDLATDQIRQGLTADLNTLLKSAGRRVGFLSLQSKEDPPGPFKGESVIEYVHHEYPDPIKLKVSVLMIPTNRALYKAKGKPKLEEWFNTNLREVVDLSLFGMSYVDLLLDFPKLKLTIDDAMNLRAQEIGYKIDQLMTILYLEPFEWLKRIDIAITGTASNNGQVAEALFETGLSNFYVGLEIFLTARVKDLRGISPYLVAKVNVPQRMKEEIIRLVRNLLHGTHPERFHMRYERIAGAVSSSNEISFEEELRKKIHSFLKTEFNAEVIDLVLKPTRTDLLKTFDEVAKAAQDFAARAELGSHTGALTIIVKGSFKIVDINDWKVFKGCDANVAAVRKRIEDGIRAHLKSAREDQMNFTEETGIDGSVAKALQRAAALVSEEFGLVVRLTTSYWDWEDALKQFGRQQDEKMLISVQEKIFSLQEQRLEMIEQDESPEAIKDIEDRIRRLSATLRPALAAGIGVRQIGKPKAENLLSSSEVDQTDR